MAVKNNKLTWTHTNSYQQQNGKLKKIISEEYIIIPLT